MSHGGLNILGKKSWNVWNRDNRERVARDEARAEEEAQAKRRRSEAAEQEARLDVLRGRARAGAGAAGSEGEAVAKAEGALFDERTGHINLFAESRSGTAPNAEAEAERRAAKEAEERRVGIVKYLDEGTATRQWYERAPGAAADDEAADGARKAPGDERRFPLSAEARQRYDDKRKERADPLGHAAALLAAAAPRPPAAAPLRSKAPAKPAYDSVAALRAEREARERAERAKTERLLNPQAAAATTAGARGSGYNSGYNSAFQRR